MANSNPAPLSGIPIISPNPYAVAIGAHGAPNVQLNITGEEQRAWTRFYLACGGHSSYYPPRYDSENRALSATPPFFDHTPQTIPELDSSQNRRWTKCHLLSLPKELRLQIYEYVLADPSTGDSCVEIDRQRFSASYKFTRAPVPRLKYYASKEPKRSIALILTNRFIYEEAVPVLYSHPTFVVGDLQGLLPLFLGTISPFARSYIRKIDLNIPETLASTDMYPSDRSKPYFHWAVTCAQVAQLNGTLRRVGVVGEYSIFESLATRRAILYPLCKIKAKKKFFQSRRLDGDEADYNTAFQQLLDEAEQALKSTAKIREQRKVAEAFERAKREAERKLEEEERARSSEIARVKAQTSFSGHKYELEDATADPSLVLDMREGAMHGSCMLLENEIKRIDKDLSLLPGFPQFETELNEYARQQAELDGHNKSQTGLDDWDLVSVRSGVSTPRVRPASVSSKGSGKTWPDTASTLVGKDDVGKYDKSDTESDSWEHVERGPHFPPST